MNKSNMTNGRVPNHTHAWRGAWNRPMYMDEDCMHPFTIARMTDHNVRGVDLFLPDTETYSDMPEPESDKKAVKPRNDLS